MARQAGIDGLELIYEGAEQKDNPLAIHDGEPLLQEITSHYGVVAISVCADRLLESPVVASDLADRAILANELCDALPRWSAGGIERVVLPFVDANRIRGPNGQDAVAAWMGSVLPAAEAAGIELHLEADLDPNSMRALLNRLDHPLIRVNYDTGNSASLGYDTYDELEAYGSRIGSIHIKDRVRNGGSVPLGEGDADIELALRGLHDLGFEGDLVLQVVRAPDGREVNWARRNAAYVRELCGG